MVNIPDYTLRVLKDGEPDLGDPRRGRQADASDAAAHRDDEIHHRQPDLERAAVDHQQRISAGAAAGSDRARRAWASRSISNRDGSVHIYQPPGDGNALGRIRFNFPNQFLVYQHDTPDKHLFAHDERAYSHGCMRVQDPPKYAEVLLGIARPNEGYTAERISKMYGHAEQRHPVPRRRSRCTSPIRPRSSTTPASCRSAQDIYGRDARACSPRSRATSAWSPTARGAAARARERRRAA